VRSCKEYFANIRLDIQYKIVATVHPIGYPKLRNTKKTPFTESILFYPIICVSIEGLAPRIPDDMHGARGSNQRGGRGQK
jgi:hypothetical protein